MAIYFMSNMSDHERGLCDILEKIHLTYLTEPININVVL